MYLALALYSVGQALVIPNWVAGPSNLIAFAILFALRVRAEERMMFEGFGDEYAAYSARTNRLIPGVWSRNTGRLTGVCSRQRPMQSRAAAAEKRGR